MFAKMRLRFNFDKSASIQASTAQFSTYSDMNDKFTESQFVDGGFTTWEVCVSKCHSGLEKMNL